MMQTKHTPVTGHTRGDERMTNPICLECLRLGMCSRYEDQPHVVVVTENGECPACGLRVAEDIVWCRICEVAAATEPGQLCGGCAGAIGTYEVTQAEIDRLPAITPTTVLLGFRTEPEDVIDYEAREEAFYGW